MLQCSDERRVQEPSFALNPITRVLQSGGVGVAPAEGFALNPITRVLQSQLPDISSLQGFALNPITRVLQLVEGLLLAVLVLP